MSYLTTALRFLRQNAIVKNSTYEAEFESLDSFTQTKWLEEAVTELQKTGQYVLASKYTRDGNTLVCDTQK